MTARIGAAMQTPIHHATEGAAMNDPQSTASRATVLVVDDTPDNLALMSGLLRHLYRVQVANSGEKALKLLEAGQHPDLILLDIMMPGLSGYDVCARLKADLATRDIPVIFLTAITAAEEEAKGLELGAVDFISKPVNPPVVMARVATQLKVKAAADFLRDQNAYLETEVRRRTREIAAIQDVTVFALASMAETRDNETGNHIRRTQQYVGLLAAHLKHHGRFAEFLNDRTIEALVKSAPLHDIGKIGIPDRILLKPGRFTPEEFEIMKTHTTIGRDALRRAEAQLGVEVEFLRLAKEIAYSHQEKWDGSGYPEGIGGDDIPISARLMAVADVYDALISRRVYKDGLPHEKAVEVMMDGSGSHFDPDIADAFFLLSEEFRQIALRHADDDASLQKMERAIGLAAS
jgi:putative two-component system response regulator